MDEFVGETLRHKYYEVMEAARKHLSPILEYANFTHHKASHKCAYECFDKSRRTEEEITSCLQNCSIPRQRYMSEIADFQEKLARSLLFCRDKFEAAELQKKTGDLNALYTCADETTQHYTKMLPHLASTLKASLGMTSGKYGTQVDDFAAADEQLAEKIRQKSHEVNEAFEEHLWPLRDYLDITLEKACHKCAYECFDGTRWIGEIENCRKNCLRPLYNARQIYDSKLANFTEKLKRSLLVCQDRYEAAKLQKKTGALNDALACVDESFQENIKMLPHITHC